MTEKTGTLAELNVQPGDMVEFEVGNGRKISHTIAARVKGCFVSKETGRVLGGAVFWSLISRASNTPKTWGEMTDAEKGALLLAHHEGKKIEWSTQKPLHVRDKGGFNEWRACPRAVGNYDNYAYRIKPEPKRELYWGFSGGEQGPATHRLSFYTLDDEPVLDTIRMEKIGEDRA